MSAEASRGQYRDPQSVDAITPHDSDILRPSSSWDALSQHFASRRAVAEDLVQAPPELPTGNGQSFGARHLELWRRNHLERVATRLSVGALVLLGAAVMAIGSIAGPSSSPNEAQPTARIEHQRLGPEKFAFIETKAAGPRLVSRPVERFMAEAPVPPPQNLRLTLAPTLITQGTTADLVGGQSLRPSQPSQMLRIVARSVGATDVPVRNPRFGRIAQSATAHQFTSAELPDGIAIVPPEPRLRRAIDNHAARYALGRGVRDPASRATRSISRSPGTRSGLPAWAQTAFERFD